MEQPIADLSSSLGPLHGFVSCGNQGDRSLRSRQGFQWKKTDQEGKGRQALRYRIWNSGPSSKKLYKGKIQAFGTKSGLFWDHFCTFLGLLVVIFIKMPKNLQKAKKASKTV